MFNHFFVKNHLPVEGLSDLISRIAKNGLGPKDIPRKSYPHEKHKSN